MYALHMVVFEFNHVIFPTFHIYLITQQHDTHTHGHSYPWQPPPMVTPTHGHPYPWPPLTLGIQQYVYHSQQLQVNPPVLYTVLRHPCVHANTLYPCIWPGDRLDQSTWRQWGTLEKYLPLFPLWLPVTTIRPNYLFLIVESTFKSSSVDNNPSQVYRSKQVISTHTTWTALNVNFDS